MKQLCGNGHLHDEALLLLAAGELPLRTARHAERHLQTCGSCRARLQSLHAADESLRQTQAASLPATAARDRLAAALSEAAAAQGDFSKWKVLTGWLRARSPLRPTVVLRPALVLRACVVVLLVVVAATFRQVSRPLQDLLAAYEDTGPEPNHVLTPGSAAPLSVAEVCRKTDDDLDPPVPFETQRAVFHAYSMDDRASKAYQVDYLINPQLGGDSSLQNLWPEPYHATVWNATAKDALETRLHGMVCSGQLDLHTAQQELAGDWIAAYKKYFHTLRPVRTVAALSQTKDR